MKRISRVQYRGETRYAFNSEDGYALFDRGWNIGSPVTGVPVVEIKKDEARLLPPIEPGKIVCVGRNYAKHAEELGNELPKEPLLFLKAPSAIVTDGDRIILPEQSSRVEHEGELGVVIGVRSKDISTADQALASVFGFVCANDVTARDIQRHDVQFTRGKSFDTFCPVGSEIVIGADVSDAVVETLVNGESRQHGRTSEMVFDIPYLLMYISKHMTLMPGDLVLTGTPAGVSPLNDGDVCTVRIEGIGTMTNPVTAKAQGPGEN